MEYMLISIFSLFVIYVLLLAYLMMPPEIEQFFSRTWKKISKRT